MSSNAIPRKQLFTASCLALLVTSLSFGIRAGILGKLGTDFNLNASELGTIAATAFWGFPAGHCYRRFYRGYYRHEKIAGNGIYLSPGGYYSYHFCRRLLDLISFHPADRHRQWNCGSSL